MKASQAAKAPDYLSYPKRFVRYKWYKPLLVTLIGVGIFFLLDSLLFLVSAVYAAMQGLDITKMLDGGYDRMDAYSTLGAVMSFGSVALMLPALLLGNLIVRSRPFSSYSSSRGGFDFGVFFKCFGVALVLIALPLALASALTSTHTGVVKFTVPGFILATILVPLQCVAEEYVFRGHLMQMLGSWIKFPVIPILLQTVAFAAMHPYNGIGVLTIAIMGIAMGFCTYITRGLEASCVLHIINNMVTLYLTGFGVSRVSSQVEFADLCIAIAMFCLYTAFIVFADKKLGWFNRIKKDDVAAFNAKVEARRKAA